MYALTIKTAVNTSEITLHHGDAAPGYELEYLLNHNVMVFADGSELEMILNNFRNLPISSSIAQVWFGDTAKMIHSWIEMHSHFPDKGFGMNRTKFPYDK